MITIQQVNNRNTADITVLIDILKGFHDLSLGQASGGVLYVPGGEAIVAPASELITGAQGQIFILAQDYHPAGHISFMTNHPGVMEYRKGLLREAGKSEDQVMNPLELPFSEIVLNREGFIIGLKEADGRIRRVELETTSGLAPTLEDRGRVTRVLDDYLPEKLHEIRGATTQTLWTPHCVQGTESSLFEEGLHLPAGLDRKLRGDLMSPIIYHHDPETGNEFYVVRKGMRSEVDSYGIGVENDKKTETHAKEVFSQLATRFAEQDVEDVRIRFGGLATNFCVEFSGNNMADFLVGHFKMRGMTTTLDFIPEISAGIPIPGGKDDPFSLNGVSERLKESRNIGTISLQEVLAERAGSPSTSIAGDLSASGPQQPKAARG